MGTKEKIISCVLAAVLSGSALTLSAAAEGEIPKVRIVVSNNTNDSAPWTGDLIDEWVELKDNSTAAGLFSELVSAKGLTQTGAESGYVTEIGGLSAEGMGGWMFGYDDWFGNNGISSFKAEDGSLEDGDELHFAYSMNWGVDIGADFNNTSTKLSALNYYCDNTYHSIELTDETSYDIELPEGTEQIRVIPTAENKNYRFKVYKNSYTPDEKNDYKTSEYIDINDGDSVIIGVGHASWHGWMPDGVTETVYTINVTVPSVQESSEPSVPDVSQVSAESSVIEVSEISKPETTKPSADEMLKAVTDKISSADHNKVGFEWENMALSKLGKMSDNDKKAYLDELKKYISENPLDRPTDFAKYTIVLSSMGVDAENYEGNDLVKKLTDTEFDKKTGLNGTIYALIALDSKPYYKDDNKTRDVLINDILDGQLEDGGWAFFGENYDCDMTAMALKALASYSKTNEKVKTAVEKAVSLLSGVQKADGAFCGFDGAENCDTTAEVISALSILSIDPANDKRFVKDGSAIDALTLFYKDGDFSHTADDAVNKYSTSEAFLALCAYDRFKNGKTSLYDMSDVFGKQTQGNSGKEESSALQSGTKSSAAAPSVTTSSASSNIEAVQTSDGSLSVMITMITVLSAAGLVILFLYKRKISK